jgi:hypothetical protein
MSYDTATFTIVSSSIITNILISIAEIACIALKINVAYILVLDFVLLAMHVFILVASVLVIYLRKTQKEDIIKGRLIINIPTYIIICLTLLNVIIDFILSTLCLFISLALLEIIAAVAMLPNRKKKPEAGQNL